MFSSEKCSVVTTNEPKIKLNVREIRDELNMHNKLKFINQLVSMLFIVGIILLMKLWHQQIRQLDFRRLHAFFNGKVDEMHLLQMTT